MDGNSFLLKVLISGVLGGLIALLTLLTFTSINTYAATTGPGQVIVTGSWESTQVGVDAQGLAINTWKYKENGVYVTGWKEILGKWYYMGADGIMLASCVVEGCILGADGAMIVQNGSAKTPTEQTTPNKPATTEKEEDDKNKDEKQTSNTGSVMDWLGSEGTEGKGTPPEYILSVNSN